MSEQGGYMQGDCSPECGGCLVWEDSERFNGQELRCDECGHVVKERD